MRTLDDALNQFAYHPATPEVSKTYAQLRSLVMELAKTAWPLVPDGPEKTTAMRGLQQFLMHANLAVAMTTPADLETPDVARVLPGQTTIEEAIAAPAVDAVTTPEPPLKPEEGASTRPGRCICQGTIVPPGFSQHRVEGTLHVRPGYGAECEKTVQASAADYQ